MISFVYFDLGGVVELDFSGTDKWAELKQELGITAENDEEFKNFWKQYEDEVCVGRDVDTLLPLFKEKFGTKLPDGYSLLLDGFVNRFEINKSIWPVIDEIRRHCRVGLLTDMYPGMFAAIKKRGLLPEIAWDVIIDSSIEGVRKPNPRIFQLAEEKAGVKGRDILFVENSLGNVKTAQDFGWQTFLYDSANPDISSRNLSIFFRGTLIN